MKCLKQFELFIIACIIVLFSVGCSQHTYPILNKKYQKPLTHHNAKQLPCSSWVETSDVKFGPL